MCEYPRALSSRSFPVAGSCLGRNRRGLLWSARFPGWGPGPGRPSCTRRTAGMAGTGPPAPGSQRIPAGVAALVLLPAPASPTCCRSRSDRPPGGATGPAERPPPPAEGDGRADTSPEVAPIRARHLPPAPARERLSGNRIQPAPRLRSALGLLPH